jgi:hypothetical protein
MTDGTPASIAANRVDVREYGDKANITWMYQALINLLGTPLNVIPLPAAYPGATNSIVWWTTTNMQTMSYAFLAAGIETSWSMISRSAIHRTFTASGQHCTQNVVDPNVFILRISETGYTFGMIFAIGQMIAVALAIGGCVPWIISRVPISPAVRLACDGTYFVMMLGRKLATANTDNLRSSMETDLIWQQLDTIVRVGESKKTTDDPDFGSIVIERPKMVSDFSWTKIYV